jgi:purine-cytosine permease-like protein
MGPAMGLRQVSISRYSMGWWPAKIIAFLNVIEQVGWSSVGCITGGLALSAVSDGRINLVLGVVIIAIIGMIFSFVGLRAVLSYEKYAWAVFFVIFLVMVRFYAKFMFCLEAGSLLLFFRDETFTLPEHMHSSTSLLNC